MGEVEKEEKDLTRKALRKHIIFTTVSCLVVALISTASTAFPFYYKTNNNIENLIDNDKKQDDKIQSVNTTLQEINGKLGNTKTITAVSDEKIDNLEEKVNDIQETQNKILDLLIKKSD